MNAPRTFQFRAASEQRSGAVAEGTPTVERVLRFGRDGTIVGVLTEPLGRPVVGPAVLFITAGMVHRVGPNRMHVMLARELARRGVMCVRFDLSGIGDSPQRTDAIPADESAVLDTQQVIAALQLTRGVNRFVLAGLCSGAVTAFRTAVRDERVSGTVLLNPQGFHHDAEWNAHVQNLTHARLYVTRAATHADNWRRALTGRINYRRAFGVLLRRAVRVAAPRPVERPIARELSNQFAALNARGARTLVICCDGDSSIDYMGAIFGRDVSHGVDLDRLHLTVFSQTDHSFTLARSQRALLRAIEQWLDQGMVAPA